jgi:hypothetical protein
MQVIHPVCCGIDCHQAQLTVCLRRVSEDGQITTQLREFGTTYKSLFEIMGNKVAVPFLKSIDEVFLG